VCGLGYVNPRPTPEEIVDYYPADYFADRDDPQSLRRYERQAEYVSVGAGAKLLDIGTAGGAFLRVMQRRGFDVEGVEASANATLEDVRVHRLRFPEECQLARESYDVITAWAVFEHLHAPGRAFAECARLLRPGGKLVAQVPNLTSAFSRWSRQEDIPRHLYFFSRPTLKTYARVAGLDVVDFIHTTDLFGGSGRGVGRLWLMRVLGKSADDFFAVLNLRRRERFRRRPLLAVPWTLVAAVERVVLADWLVRRARISGQVVAVFAKPGGART
jgi:SAM-dependent methyltransferase